MPNKAICSPIIKGELKDMEERQSRARLAEFLKSAIGKSLSITFKNKKMIDCAYSISSQQAQPTATR
jgi:hypothetical protein